MHRQQTFRRLKQSCVELLQVVATLSQQPNAKRDLIQALTQLLRVLQDVSRSPESVDAKLAEFVFVPISRVLSVSSKVPVRALELCLECISILLETGWRTELSAELSGQLLILFTFLANPSSAENGIPATSEELQAGSFQCMTALLIALSSTSARRLSLTTTANIPTLGKAVLVMVDSIAENNSNNVRLQAVLALEAMINGIDDRDVLASFLPRMVSSLAKALTPISKNRANFRLLEKGINTMSLLLLRLLSDRETKHLPLQASKDTVQGGEKLRTTQWLRATASQIKIALANVLKLRDHNKPEVRRALLYLCLHVIQDCRVSLSDCTNMMVETLITLTGRCEEQGAIESELKTLLHSDMNLAGLLRESLHSWILSLPRLMQSKDDVGRRQIIQQISITLRLLSGEQMELTMIDDLLAANLRDGVSSILNDSKGLVSSTQATNTMSRLDVTLGTIKSAEFQPLKLLLKGQDDMMEEFRILVHELAGSISATVVVQDLITSLDSGTEESRLATFWLVVNLLRDMIKQNQGFEDFVDSGVPDIRVDLLDELYSSALAKLTTSNTDLDQNWQLQALALEVIALQARKHKLDFRGELIETLYPVLHLLGSPNPELRNHAITCLNVLADSCGYVDASDLVVSNVDYIVNAVGLKLNYHDVSPQAPQVLMMIIRLCGPSLLPFFDDLVGSIFSALERYHGYPKLVELLFSVLKGMTEEGVKAPQLLIPATRERTNMEENWKVTTVSEVAGKLGEMKQEAGKEDEDHVDKSFHHSPRTEDADECSNEQSALEVEDSSLNNRTQQTEIPPPIPKTFDILLRISESTQHYLTSASPSLRSSLLSLLHTTIPALARHENTFLPLINTLWPVLLPRLGDKEAFVISNALDIVALMCRYAGNFMKSRIEGSWEDFKAIYHRTINHTENSKGNRHKYQGLDTTCINDGISSSMVRSEHSLTGPYVDAPTRMVADSLVALFSTIYEYVAVREETLDDIIDMLDPFFERLNVRKALESRNPDLVWLRRLRKGNLRVIDMGAEPANIADISTVLNTMPSSKAHWSFAQPPS
ncbi:ARM repeat-containing protein [Lojkania enalia]|uniref:ARM repeat-containing protein n=1 Tax=Lojkania enalia TaxID=147567 RepID=A0A9P4NBM0_9PLEO|nr:ARM repeat-containing protein [Didymosphaeria enalia]